MDNFFTRKYDRLKVIEFHEQRGKRSFYWCECDCGNKISVNRSNLVSNNTTSCGCKHKPDLTDQEFGLLTVLRQDGVSKRGGRLWVCKCQCGNLKTVEGRALKQLDNQSCGCLLYKSFNGFKELSGSVWSKIRGRAISRNISLELTVKDAYELLEKQNFTCPYTGNKIVLKNKAKIFDTASLDRINSDLGYSKKNCQWVAAFVNIMKWELPRDEFLSWIYLTNNPIQTEVLSPVLITKRILQIWANTRTSVGTAFDFTLPFLQNKLDEQKYCCAITGVPLYIHQHHKFASRLTTASIDRIDSSIGYIPSNIQFVHKNINKMKLSYSMDKFKSICQQISKHSLMSK